MNSIKISILVIVTQSGYRIRPRLAGFLYALAPCYNIRSHKMWFFRLVLRFVRRDENDFCEEWHYCHQHCATYVSTA
jgi:hypothetical protein